MFAVTILGNNSALSMHDRHQTAQVVTCESHQFLVDCGESTQNQLQRYKIKRSKIDHIFISHLHGDHYFGIPGLLNTYNLTSRKNDLHIFGPPELEEIIHLMNRVSGTSYGFRLLFHPLREAGTVLDTGQVRVSCFPVSHRITCWGFRFDLAGKPAKIRDHESVRPEQPSRSYAYCADTCYDETIIPYIHGADLLYHEATYLDDQAEKAAMRFHSTSSQAARIATKARVGRLLLGHYSSKYDDVQPFESEARLVFPQTDASREGISYLV